MRLKKSNGAMQNFISSVFGIVAVLFFALDANNVAWSAGKERMLYVGKDSTEARLTFKASVWISKQSNGAAPTPAVIRAKIDRQVAHLFGPMAADTYTAVPKGDHTIQTGAVQAVGNGQYKVEYQYVGTAVIKITHGDYTVLRRKPDRFRRTVGFRRYACQLKHSRKSIFGISGVLKTNFKTEFITDDSAKITRSLTPAEYLSTTAWFRG